MLTIGKEESNQAFFVRSWEEIRVVLPKFLSFFPMDEDFLKFIYHFLAVKEKKSSSSWKMRKTWKIDPYYQSKIPIRISGCGLL